MTDVEQKSNQLTPVDEPNQTAEFVHLKLHSEYSMVDGICRINNTLDRAAEFRMPAIAITDHANFCGLI